MQKFFPFIIVGIFALVVVAWKFFLQKEARIKWKLKRAPFIPLSEFLDGNEGKVVGKIHFVDEPLTAPLSGRRCALYQIKVEQKKNNGNSSSYSTIIQEQVSSKFLIQDGDKYAYIVSSNLHYAVNKDGNFNSGFLNDANERMDEYLQKHGHKSTGFLGFNRSIRYKEGVLEENEVVAAFGSGTWKRAKDLGLPEEYGKVLAINGPNNEYNGKVYLSDHLGTLSRKRKEKEIIQTSYEAPKEKPESSRKSRYLKD